MEGKASLPEELKFKILLELSIKTLLRFKSICKNWQSLIESPTFTNCYCSTSCSKNNNRLLWFHWDLTEEKKVISLIDCQTTQKIANLEWLPCLDGVEDEEEYNRRRDISILGPVNGVYCMLKRLFNRWVGILILWNPATREYKRIAPQVSFPFSSEFFEDKWFNHWYYRPPYPRALNVGFGFDHRTNDFKVIAICHWEMDRDIEEDSWHVRVYSLSTDSWRTIHYIKPYESSKLGGLNISCTISSYPDCVHCYLNGVFHWATGSEYGILAFDVAMECFQLIKGPPLPKDEYPFSSVWAYKETIAMAFTVLEHNRYPIGAFVWMMTEYGVEDSWTMLYSCGPVNGLAIIGIPNAEQIFFSDVNGQLISYNWEEQVFKESGEYGGNPNFFPSIYGNQQVLRYVESVVSLKPMHHEQ